MSVNSVLTDLADKVRTVEGSTGKIAGLENLVGRAIALMKSGGTTANGLSILVDEIIDVTSEITSYVQVYQNPKVLGDKIFPYNWCVMMWLPIKINELKNSTRTLVAGTGIPIHVVHVVTSNGSNIAEAVYDPMIIQGGIVHVGPLTASAPIRVGQYRLVIIVK